MSGSDFDIYQTDSGYVAVTNNVRRAILLALAKKDRQLPELVKLTRKAKPTLSSVHMRDLIASRLVDELPHPSDRRKKIYRLRGKRIGSSNLPVGELRTAVKSYVAGARNVHLPLAASLEAIAAAPPSASDATLRAQARRLGELASESLPPGDARASVGAMAALFEREGLARPLKLDLEGLALEVEIAKPFAQDAARGALLLAGLTEGLLAPRAGVDARARGSLLSGARVALHLPSW